MSEDNHHQGNDKASSNELLLELGSLKDLLDEELQETPAYHSVEEIASVGEYLRLKQQANDANLPLDEFLRRQAAQTATPLSVDNAVADMEEEPISLLDEVVLLDEEEADTPFHAAEEPALLPTQATTVEEYFRAVAAAKQRPVASHHTGSKSQAKPEQVVAPGTGLAAEESIPLLDEMVAPDDAIPVLDEVVDENAIPVLDEMVMEADAIPVLADVATEEVEASLTEAEELNLEQMQGLVDLIVQRKLERLKPELEKEVMAELQRLLPLSAVSKP